VQVLGFRAPGPHENEYGESQDGPNTYNHYPTGWAVALSTPFQMFKRYSQFAGGTCCPLVIHWPKGIKAKGEVRHQYHHSTDIVPTILEVAVSRCPRSSAGSSSVR
jgi:arylsulfatase A-like enzyme